MTPGRRPSRSAEPQHRIYPHVSLGSGAQVGWWVILGELPQGRRQPATLTTRIGSQARIRSHTVIYAGSVIGDRFQTGHGAMVREHACIGDDVSVGSHAIVEHHVTIGHRVRIHSGAFIPEYTVLEDDVWVGPHVVLTNARYPASADAKQHLQGPEIRAGAKLGANATVLPGVVIGRQAVVGAGAVVVRDVPEGAVVVGNPARVLKRVHELPAYAVEQLLAP